MTTMWRSRLCLSALALLALRPSVLADEVNVFAAASLTEALEGGRSGLREQDRPQGGLQPWRIERTRAADQGRRAGRRVLLGGQGPDGRTGEGRSRPSAGPHRRSLQRPRRHRAHVVHGTLLRPRRSAERQTSGPGRPAGGSGRGVCPRLARVRGPLEPTQGQGRSDPQRAGCLVGRGVGERRCRHRVPHGRGDIETRQGGVRGAEGTGAGDRLSARAHRGVETGRHRGSGAASPLRSRSGDLCAPRLHRPRWRSSDC